MPKHELVARDIMTASVRTVNQDSSLHDALAIMDGEGYSQVPVMDGRKPIALLTEADARRAVMQNRLDRSVLELASPLPLLISPATRISRVLHALEEQESILVVSDKGLLAGIITYWDVMVLSRPYMMVKEVELLLRRVVAATYQQAHGPDWWDEIPLNLREQAEREHGSDREDGDDSPEHMLGHTSLWALIEIFHLGRPDLDDRHFGELHEIRKFRNKVAHLYILTPAEQRELTERCLQAGDWLEGLLPEQYPLRRRSTER